MSQTTATQRSTQQAPDKNALRPFHVNVPEAELTDLKRRILATKWLERETVTDATQGVQLATVQALARYWATEYDWRRIEAQLSALPQLTRASRHDRPVASFAGMPFVVAVVGIFGGAVVLCIAC